jgi:hypothetical protein
MALKDWKLVVNRKDKLHWENKKEDEKEVMIVLHNFNDPSGYWEFHYIEPNDSFIKLSHWKSKLVKNKFSAMLLAKKYLREN